MDLNKLTTEKRNERSMNLDTLSTEQVIRLMNEEDAVVPKAIEQIVPTIAKAVDAITARFKKNGRLIYIGAGTSGRLGVLDAVECVPTFGVPPEKVVGVIAGGDRAMYRAVEGAEDSPTLGQQDLTALSLTKEDVVVGIAASGRTPYVIGALTYANEVGAETIALSCNQDAEISAFANIAIEVIVGAEVLTGSTRLKAGTAQKLVLNMLSTASMIGIGKVYNNLMVDVQPTNEKLRVRAVRIIQQATECTEEQAQEAFEQSGGQVKIAIVMILFDQTKKQAEETLVQNQGFIRKTT